MSNINEQISMAFNADDVLIAYFSHSGNTRFVAENIQKIIGDNVDIFEIKPVTDYPENYTECVDRAKGQCAEGFKPELTQTIEDAGKYNVIFVGTPNWWYTMSPPVLSFLSSCDVSNKTIIPFVTHGGGGVARCETDIKKACPESSFCKTGLFRGKGTESEIANWINEIVTIQK